MIDAEACGRRGRHISVTNTNRILLKVVGPVLDQKNRLAKVVQGPRSRSKDFPFGIFLVQDQDDQGWLVCYAWGDRNVWASFCRCLYFGVLSDFANFLFGEEATMTDLACPRTFHFAFFEL
jgi:hypothetical protein